MRRFRGWTGKTFLSRIPFKSAVNAGRASKGPGVRVAYKEKNRLGGGEEKREKRRGTFQSLNCGAPERWLQCSAQLPI